MVRASTFPAMFARGRNSVGDRLAIVVRSTPGRNRGALAYEDGMTIAEAARTALERRLPLVLVLASSGADVVDGINAMHGWGAAAAGMARCSGIVPVLAAVTGPAISGSPSCSGLRTS